MSSTIVTSIGDGFRTDYTFSFEYLSKAFVVVMVNKVPASFTFHTPYTLCINPPPPAGADVTIRRVTSQASIIEFVDGSLLLADDLNIASVQAIHIASEALDLATASLLIADGGAFSVGARRLSDVGTPTQGTDAVTKVWAETGMSSQLAQALSAAAEATTKASEAATSQAASAASATSAAASAATATSKATAADNSATAAASSAASAAIALAAISSLSGLKILRGTATTSASAATRINFPSVFSDTPIVVCNMRMGVHPENGSVRYSGDTSTGFDASVYDAGGNRIAASIGWIAIGAA